MLKNGGLGMSIKVRLREINVAKLNSETVILITKFLRKARVHQDFDLHIQQPEVVRKIIQYAEHSKDPDLIVLSMRIKKALASHIKEIDPECTSFNIYH